MNSAPNRTNELLTTREGRAITAQELGNKLERTIGVSSAVPSELRDRLVRASEDVPAAKDVQLIALDVATWMVRQPQEPTRQVGLELFEWLVGQDCAWAMYNLAIENLLGVSCAPNIPMANELLEKVTVLAGTETILLGLAYGALADSYGQGRGVSQDHVQALQLYERAAEFGNPEAAFNAGLYYEATPSPKERPSPNLLKAAYFYELAAGAGLGSAKIKLGMLHATLAFPGADPQVGKGLLEEAAADGDPIAIAALEVVRTHLA